MTTATFTEVRGSFKQYCDRAVDNEEAVVVTRERGGNVVIISEEEWDSIQETMFFLADGNRMARLERSLDDFSEGRFQEFADVSELRRRAMANVAH